MSLTRLLPIQGAQAGLCEEPESPVVPVWLVIGPLLQALAEGTTQNVPLR